MGSVSPGWVWSRTSFQIIDKISMVPGCTFLDSFWVRAYIFEPMKTSTWHLHRVTDTDGQINSQFTVHMTYRLLCLSKSGRVLKYWQCVYLCCVHCAVLQETPCGEEPRLLQTFCQNTPCHDPTSPLRRGAERRLSAHTQRRDNTTRPVTYNNTKILFLMRKS